MPIILIISGIPLLSLAWWIWADRRLKKLGASRLARIALSLAMTLLLAGYVWVILGRRDLFTTPIPAGLYALVLLWALIFLPLTGLPAMLLWSIGSIFQQLFRRKKNLPSESTDARKWTRREWLGATAVTFPLISTFAATAYGMTGISRFRIREITLPIKDLPEALEGLRIAHLTDTHVGKFTRGEALDEIVAATNRLQADLVLFTGDLIDNTIRDLPVAVQMLQRLQSDAGLFVIEGNHDLFDDPSAFVKGIRDGGLALLRNESATVHIRGVAVQILGLVWQRAEKEIARSVDAVAALRDPAAFPILLAHHPHAFDRAAELGFPLTLAGHTHGGQLMLNRDVGAGSAMFRYWTGLYQNLTSALVVGNGTGNWFPLRLNAPAEIIHLTLRKG